MQGRNIDRIRSALAMPIAIAVVLALAAIPALGGRNNDHDKGDRGKGPQAAHLIANCNPCAVGQPVEFSGAGYETDRPAHLDVDGSPALTGVTEDGTISFVWPGFERAGTHTVSVYQDRNRNRSELKASLAVEIVDPSDAGSETAPTLPVESTTTSTAAPTPTSTTTTTAAAPAPTSTTTTTAAAPTTTTTTTPTSTTTQAAPPTTQAAGGPTEYVFDQTTTLTDQVLVLRPGDSIRLENGARLIFGKNATLDAQGTPVSTWSWNGRDLSSVSRNLERDIEITGRGHLMFAAGSLPATIKYVEVDVQPDAVLGHYPLHWHLAGDSSRGTLVEGVVVKNSTNRAYVPHGSHGISFKDNIAVNTVGAAFWWDSARFATDRFTYLPENESHDITVNRLLVDGVTNEIGDDRGFRLGGVDLKHGRNNSITNSVVVNVRPSHQKDCAAYVWGEDDSGVWDFRNNHGDSSCHGIFVWQNNGGAHVIDGFSGGGIDHGAYGNNYSYRNVDVPYVEVHASGWSMSDSTVDQIISQRHQFDGSVSFDRVTVTGQVVLNDAGSQPVDLVFTNSAVSCSQVSRPNAHPESNVVIDGVPCP